MKNTTPPTRKHLATLLLTTALYACGSQATPPPEAPKPPEKTIEAAPTEPTAEPTGPSPEAIAQCLATANATRAKFSGEPPKITVKHILILHKASKKNEAGIKRTREEACMRAMEAREKLREGADFDEIVKQYSEEPGAATRNGMLGSVERTNLAKPFADAAFELSINQMSDIVETEFGFHLIVRTE